MLWEGRRNLFVSAIEGSFLRATEPRAWGSRFDPHARGGWQRRKDAFSLQSVEKGCLAGLLHVNAGGNRLNRMVGMNVSFEYYKVFYHVARLGSITLAAKALFLSQPAVSKCIRQLEKVLGCALFYRMHKGMRLTPEGEVLYQHVAQACEQIAIGEKKIQAMLHLDWGSIHIGSSDMIMHAFLLPYLEQFHKDYPKVRISTITASTPETIASLRARRIDLGVVFSPVEENEDLDIIPVCRVQDTFIAGNTFRHLEGSVLSPDEVAKLPIVCPEKGTSTRAYLDAFFQSHGVVLDPECELATTVLIVPFAERGLGVGITVRRFAEESLRAGSVFELQTTHKIPKRAIAVVTRKRSQISHAGHAFIRCLTGKETEEAGGEQPREKCGPG